jgi:hypothetical protein
VLQKVTITAFALSAMSIKPFQQSQTMKLDKSEIVKIISKFHHRDHLIRIFCFHIQLQTNLCLCHRSLTLLVKIIVDRRFAVYRRQVAMDLLRAIISQWLLEVGTSMSI